MKIALKHIHKYFGAVRANDDITLTIESGMIYGLLGENGAGKSTLMKVLSGYIFADSGQILLDGNAVRFTSPASAIEHRVGMLHQDPLDFPPMQLVDNFMTGRAGRLWLDRRSAARDFRQLCQQFDFDLDPNAFVADITVGERQQLEIVRLLWRGVETLILDEPTTGISAPQKVKLFATLKALAAQGKTILFVSHKLEDVDELCAQVAVLRQGQVAGEMTAPLTADALIDMMFGQAITVGDRPRVDIGPPLLELDRLAITDRHMQMDNVSLTVGAGEVVGIAGLEGAGQRLLMQACAGLLPASNGQLRLDGMALTNQNYPSFVDAGVAFMPANRMAEGLVPGLTIAEHIVLARRRPGNHNAANQPADAQRSAIDWAAARTATLDDIAEYNIKGQPESTVDSLSGGNQQRVLLALLPPTLRLLIMEHPTRGLDVESAIYIWGKLLARRAAGTAILYSSADLDEIMQYSDRILVCCGGQITAVVQTAETTITELGYLIAGRTLVG